MKKINRWVIITTFFIGIIITSSLAQATTINVPADHSTIQAAINVANNGYEVLVSAVGGPYIENIVFSGIKTITVKTTDGAVIDGNSSGSVVTFTGGDTSTIDGFTITGGSGNNIPGENGTFGGGIQTYYSSPKIKNCTISGNSSTHHGGGILCWHSLSIKITNCIINNNSSGHGGGIECIYADSCEITNCIITGNWADDKGGGI
jgi:predicted outer membrane repeat protein